MFVGSCTVAKGQGMEVLDEAVQRLSLDQSQWEEVSVDVAISNITITDKVSQCWGLQCVCVCVCVRDDCWSCRVAMC